MQDRIEASIKLDEGGELQIVGNKILIETEQIGERFGKLKLLYVHPEYRRWSRNGWVRAIGDDVIRENYNFRIGDFISFGSAIVGIDVLVNDKNYKIVHPADLLAKFDE